MTLEMSYEKDGLYGSEFVQHMRGAVCKLSHLSSSRNECSRGCSSQFSVCFVGFVLCCFGLTRHVFGFELFLFRFSFAFLLAFLIPLSLLPTSMFLVFSFLLLDVFHDSAGHCSTFQDPLNLLSKLIAANTDFFISPCSPLTLPSPLRETGYLRNHLVLWYEFPRQLEDRH